MANPVMQKKTRELTEGMVIAREPGNVSVTLSSLIGECILKLEDGTSICSSMVYVPVMTSIHVATSFHMSALMAGESTAEAQTATTN